MIDMQKTKSIDDASSVSTSLPSSSPISFTSSASITPAPVTNATAHSVPHSAGTTAAAETTAYDDLWAQVRTPTLSESNIPSALQTPLGPQSNDNVPGLPWLSSEQSNAADRANGPTGVENVPPITASHPPVASRMRKRRRGTSPASGERVRKSARRKGKAMAKAAASKRTFEVERDAVLSNGHDNPWAVSPAGMHAEGSLQPSTLPSAPTPAHALASANHVPYDDFSRAGSSSTSFYDRLNDSGSYPTPHRMSVSPSPSSAAPASSLTPRMPSNPLPLSISPSIMRTDFTASRSRSMDIDWRGGDVRSRSDSGSSLLERPPSRDASMAEGSQHDGRASHDARRSLRDLLSDPPARSDRAAAYRAPSVEDIPEEGEVSSASRSREAGDRHRRYPDVNPGHYAVPDNWHPRQTSTPRPAQLGGRDALPSTRHGTLSSRLSEEWGSRSPGSAFRDERSTHWPPSRQPTMPRDPPPHRPRREQREDFHSPSVEPALPANRINTLDVFDVGDDDNLPEAVRRGGTTQEGEDESPTPIPFEGDPEVHRHDPEAHLRGMSDNWVQAVWADPSDTSITLSTFNPRYTRSYGTNRRTASDLRRFITQITGETLFLVIAPDQAPGYRGRGPVEWAITGLTRGGVDTLLRRRVWSFPSITFFPHRRALDNPRWLLALEGFLEDNVTNIEAAVRSTFERPQVRHRLEQMIRANPEFNEIPIDEAFRRVMSSLRVTVYTLDNETVVANVFLRSPTQSIRVWRRWIQELRDLTFGSYHTAIARVRRISACAGCLGVDHPSHLCPFPRLANWNGPDSAGGTSYSVDGREKRGKQPPEPTPESHHQRRQRSQPPYGLSASQAGPSRSRNMAGSGDWDDVEFERGGAGGREYGRERGHDQGRRSYQRRGRRDGPGPSRPGRDNFRNDGRR